MRGDTLYAMRGDTLYAMRGDTLYAMRGDTWAPARTAQLLESFETVVEAVGAVAFLEFGDKTVGFGQFLELAAHAQKDSINWILPMVKLMMLLPLMMGDLG